MPDLTGVLIMPGTNKYKNIMISYSLNVDLNFTVNI